MTEMRESNAKHGRSERRRQIAASRDIRSNREALSRERGHIYLQGTYAPETPRRRGPLTRIEIEQIRQLRAEGKSLLDISCRLDRSTGTIRDACKYHKIPSPRKAQGGWAVKKEKENGPTAQGRPADAGKRDLLAAHDAGLCGRDCRLGRHGLRDRWLGRGQDL